MREKNYVDHKQLILRMLFFFLECVYKSVAFRSFRGPDTVVRWDREEFGI